MTHRGWLIAAGVALLALIGTSVASNSPDGLERVASDLGIEGRSEALFRAPLADYAVPKAPNAISGPLAGLIGAAAVGGLAFGAGRWLTRVRRPR